MSWANRAVAPPRTIRDDLGLILTEEIMYGRNAPRSAQRELKLFLG